MWAKRLLTDPSPELRASLKDLLFKEGSFRWNRLENLMRNAKDSEDYDIDKVVDQATDFLLSSRGEFIRERLVNEIINAVDMVSRRTWFNLSTMVREQVGLAVQETPQELQDTNHSMEHFQNILNILQNTPGFEPMRLVPLLVKLLGKPETQTMGQKIAEGLMQKLVARLIRNLLLEIDQPKNSKVATINSQQSLPAA